MEVLRQISVFLNMGLNILFFKIHAWIRLLLHNPKISLIILIEFLLILFVIFMLILYLVYPLLKAFLFFVFEIFRSEESVNRHFAPKKGETTKYHTIYFTQYKLKREFNNLQGRAIYTSGNTKYIVLEHSPLKKTLKNWECTRYKFRIKPINERFMH